MEVSRWASASWIVGGVVAEYRARRDCRLDEQAEIVVRPRSVRPFANCGSPYLRRRRDLRPEEARRRLGRALPRPLQHRDHAHAARGAVDRSREAHHPRARSRGRHGARRALTTRWCCRPAPRRSGRRCPGSTCPAFAVRTIPDSVRIRKWIEEHAPKRACRRRRRVYRSRDGGEPRAPRPRGDRSRESCRDAAARRRGRARGGGAPARARRDAAPRRRPRGVRARPRGRARRAHRGRRAAAGRPRHPVDRGAPRPRSRTTPGSRSAPRRHRSRRRDAHAGPAHLGGGRRSRCATCSPGRSRSSCSPVRRTGRDGLAAASISGRGRPFRGVQATAVVGVFGLTVAHGREREGPGALRRRRSSARVPYPGQHAGYYPGAKADPAEAALLRARRTCSARRPSGWRASRSAST